MRNEKAGTFITPACQQTMLNGSLSLVQPETSRFSIEKRYAWT